MKNLEMGDVLKPLQNPYPHRRRPLMSDTYTTLLRILSYPKLDACEEHNGGSTLPKENEPDTLVQNLFVNALTHKEFHNLVVEPGPVESRFPSGYGDLTAVQMEVDLDLSSPIKGAIEGVKDDSKANDVNDLNCLIQKTNAYIDQTIKEPGNMCSTHESDVKESDPIRQITDEKIHISETSMSEEMRHGLRLKEMEFETLISSAGATDSSLHVPVVEDIEEGEVSKDFNVPDTEMAIDVGCQKKDEAEEPDYDVRVNALQTNACASSSIVTVDKGNSFLGKEFKNLGGGAEHSVEKVSCSKDVETRKICVYDSILDGGFVAKQDNGGLKFDHPAGSHFDATSTGNAKENRHIFAAAEDDNVSKKKRGPLTKEKKAKKKAKYRIRRAEKNRKLGVKRLKLPPVVKPKVVTYCRHYLKGRCKEGEKCKFSHDTIPLTKSKPCCHFARQSCMKGDDCPFDHQLSKYPCNNYASTGFCSRRTDCLFSHEISVKATTATSSDAANIELNSPSLPSNSKSAMPVSTYRVLHQHVNSPSDSTGLVPSKSTEGTVLECVEKPATCTPNFLGKSTERTVSEPVKKPPTHTPKGVTLSHGKSFQDDPCKHEEAGSSLKADDGEKFSSQTEHIKFCNTQNQNGFTKGAAERLPQGLKFLSCGRAPSVEASSVTLSGLFNSDGQVKKLQLGDMNNSTDASTHAKRHGGSKDENQPKPNASLWSMNQISTGSVPRGINFLSAEKVAQDGLRCNELNSVSPFALGRLSAQDKTSSEMPLRQSSYLLPAGQSSNHSSAKPTLGNASSSNAPLLAQTSGSIQRALQSTLAFAAKFDLGVKYGTAKGSPDISSKKNDKTESSTGKGL